MTTPSKHDVDVTIRSLELDESEASEVRKYYDRMRRDYWKARLLPIWPYFRWSLVILGAGVILYVLVVLWFAL